LVCGLGAVFVSGCVPFAIPIPGGVERPRTVQRTSRPESAILLPVQHIEPETKAVALSHPQIIREESLHPSAFNGSELKESEPVVAPQKTEAASGADQAAAHERAANPREESPKRVAPTYWPDADDRLLDLVQKDLDKAVEVARERRRLQFSKAVVDNPRVRHYVYQFSKVQKDYLARTLERSGKYFPMISNVLHEEGLPEDLAYLALIESNLSPHAISRSGAVGLWQFIPGTAREYGLKIDSWIDERRDPVKSTRAAAAYLKDLHNYFGRWYLATAAYNAGQGAIDRAMQKSGVTDYWGLSQKNISQETRNFVPKFVAITLIASNPKKYGFEELSYEAPLEYEEVEVNRPLRLDKIAEMADTELEAIRELNPALLRNITPPDANGFRLRLPAGRRTVFAKAYEQREKEAAPVQVVTHQVSKGETLFSIARRYGQEVRGLMQLNGLSSPRLKIGQQLMIIVEKLRGGLR
jgi:membrane-bound lytic murein transglycosylase D